MREPARDPGRLQDIIQASDHIASFTDGFSEDELLSDKLRYFAVVKNVEIIGEAAFMLSKEFREKHNHIPWKDIIRMRNVLVHGYATILPELLWHTALVDVPELKRQIQVETATKLRLAQKEKTPTLLPVSFRGVRIFRFELKTSCLSSKRSKPTELYPRVGCKGTN